MPTPSFRPPPSDLELNAKETIHFNLSKSDGLGPEQPIYAQRYGHAAKNSEEILSLYDRLKNLTAHYIEEKQTVQPEDPYFLIGLCIGSFVAFEMAQLLVEQGEQVALLFLADLLIQGSLKPLPFSTKISNVIKIGHVETLTRVQEKVIKKLRRLRSQTSNRAQDKYHNYEPQKVYPGNAIIVKSVGEIYLSSSFEPELGWEN